MAKRKVLTNGMTTLDWNIYKFLKKTSEHGVWIKMNALAAMFNISPRELRKSITRIRENDTIQKILVSDYKKGYKLMAKSDEYELLLKDKIRALRTLKRYWKNAKRFNLNNQMKLTFDTQERNFIESLIKG